MRLLTVLAISLSLLSPLFGQRSGEKPVLIRPGDERPPEEPEEAPLVPDPSKAREHVDIGDFYYRRANFEAAADRYREAILYHPRWPEAYEKLVKVLAEQKAFEEAIRTCEQFVQVNHSSSEVNRFKKRAEELKKEIEKEKAEGS